ncbi:MAG: DNA primase [Dehalococcoidales bacterium]
MSVIDEVKQRTDIVEVVSQYTSLAKAGRTMKGLCPFHSEKHGSFFVYPEQQSWHCFGACNTGGDVFSFVMKKENLDFGEALRQLAGRAGVTLPSRQAPADRDKKDRLYQANATAALYFHNFLLEADAAEKARQYISGRGLNEKSTADFQLGYSPGDRRQLRRHLMEKGYTEDELLAAGLIIKPDDGQTYDRFRNQLMFPIADARGRIIGFGGRLLAGSGPKYLNSPQTPLFDKSSHLYGLNLAAPAIRLKDSAIIVEGYMDAITAHQNGFANVVASMGTSVTERQITALKKLSRNVIFALDADSAGEEATRRGVGYENILEAEIKVVVLPQGKDPDDVIRQDAEAWPGLLKGARPVMDFIFDHESSGLDLATAAGKSRLAEILLPVIARIADTVRQAHYLQQLARLVNISEHRLEVALARTQAVRSGGRSGDTVTPIATTVLADSLGDYCLGLLLGHPEIKSQATELKPEYFESSLNRQILIAYQAAEDISKLKEMLEPAIWPHLESLMDKGSQEEAERKFTSCIFRLRERYLRGMAGRMADILAAEANRGSVANLVRFKEHNIEEELRKIFVLREKWSREQRR